MANNHNRYLGHSKHYFENQLDDAKFKATQKQVNFFRRLCVLCRENGVEHQERPYGRVGFSQSIDRLIALLQAKGVDIHGNGKKIDVVISTDASNNVLEKDTTVRLKYTE